MENISQVLPKGDKQIIKDALIQYLKTLDCLIDKFDKQKNYSTVEVLHHTRFDLHSLIGFMDYDVTINMPQKVKDNFCHLHSVDFPLYNQDECKLSYPVEEESKWVTLITGDFTFIDDGEHGRECHVNQLITIEKHLREQVGEVIDCVEKDGHGWIIAEDYDGSIEMNFDKPKEKPIQFTITKKNFIDWYFNTGSDQEQEDVRKSLGELAVESLMDGQPVNITASDIWESCETSIIPIDRTEESDKWDGDFLEVGEIEGATITLID
jgi:hypothetical protein